MNKDFLQLKSIKTEEIKNLVHNIRGKQVMTDSDIAKLFEVETGYLNRQMNRNKNRFPEDFCFKLNSKEFESLLCQIGIPKKGRGGRTITPYVYTEQGILTLSGVLRSDVASKMAIIISRAFVEMQRTLMQYAEPMELIAKIENRQIEYEDKTEKRFNEIMDLMLKADLPKQKLFYKGQWYDAAEFITNIFVRAKESIFVSDPYIDSLVLTYLKHRKEGVKISIWNGPNSKLSKDDIKTYEKQYGEIIINTCDFHDRHIIMDDEECYLLGTSINYMGNKPFSVIKIENQQYIESIKTSFK